MSRLLASFGDPETHATVLAALAQMPNIQALDAYIEGLSSKDA
jgi:hypothetical protein